MASLHFLPMCTIKHCNDNMITQFTICSIAMHIQPNTRKWPVYIYLYVAIIVNPYIRNRFIFSMAIGGS